MKIMMIGDVYGEPGRATLAKLLPRLRDQHQIDFTVVNVENAAGGFGVTQQIAESVLDLGVDVMTTGNHVWDKKEIASYIGKENRLLRPANYPDGTPGVGYITVKAGPHRVTVINAALAGHENVEPMTIEAVLTEAADGISAARPGARRDVLESYIRRLAKLEEIALSYKGVEMCYAIQAGRELRVMTKADIVSDLDAHQLAKNITKRIEAEMQYPGHIKVVVIRETRAVEVAK